MSTEKQVTTNSTLEETLEEVKNMNNEVKANAAQTTEESKETTIREQARKKLMERNGSLYLIKDKSVLSKIKKGNVLEVASDGTKVLAKKTTLSLRDRLKDPKFSKKENPETQEVNMSAQVDQLEINGKNYNVAAIKALNQAVNDQEYEDQIYFEAKLTISAETVNDSILELSNPSLIKESNMLQKRESPILDDKTLVMTKKVGPAQYELGVIIPSEYGSIKMHDMDAFNKIIPYLDRVQAACMRNVLLSPEIKVDKMTKAKHSLAMANKSSIKKYLKKSLEKLYEDDEDMTEFEFDEKLNDTIGEIWDELGVKPLTDQKLKINLQILKIHRSNDPDAFTTKSRNVTIMKDTDSSVKIERLRTGFDKSFPYLRSYETTLTAQLLSLIIYFTVWADNEAKASLGYELRPMKDVKLPEINVKNEKILDMLGIKGEEATNLSDTISKLVMSKAENKAEQEMIVHTSNKLSN